MNFKDDHLSGFELRERLIGCSTTAEIAAIVVGSFEAIEQALRPIVGGRGVVALYNRSIHLVSAQRAWMRGNAEPSMVVLDLVALGAAFLRQDLEEAALGGSDLLDTFRSLLSTLIGTSLTAKLLMPAWAGLAVEPAVRGTSR